MLLFRSLTVGFLATCVWLLIGLVVQLGAAPAVSPGATAAARGPDLAADRAPVIASATAASILDVAPGVRELASIVRLAPGERVIAVDGQPVDSDLAAGAALAQLPTGRGRYVDLTVAGTHELRRIVVLLH